MEVPNLVHLDIDVLCLIMICVIVNTLNGDKIMWWNFLKENPTSKESFAYRKGVYQWEEYYYIRLMWKRDQ